MGRQIASVFVVSHLFKYILNWRLAVINYGATFTAQDGRRWMQDLGRSLRRVHNSVLLFLPLAVFGIDSGLCQKNSKIAESYGLRRLVNCSLGE